MTLTRCNPPGNGNAPHYREAPRERTNPCYSKGTFSVCLGIRWVHFRTLTDLVKGTTVDK